MDEEAQTKAIEKWLRMADKPLEKKREKKRETKRTRSQEKKAAIVKMVR